MAYIHQHQQKNPPRSMSAEQEELLKKLFWQSWRRICLLICIVGGLILLVSASWWSQLIQKMIADCHHATECANGTWLRQLFFVSRHSHFPLPLINLFLLPILMPLGCARGAVERAKTLFEQGVDLSAEMIASTARRELHVQCDPITSFKLCSETLSSIVASDELMYGHTAAFADNPLEDSIRIGRHRPFWFFGSVHVKITYVQASCVIHIRYQAGWDYFFPRLGFRRLSIQSSSEKLIGEAYFAVEAVQRVLQTAFHRRQIALDAIQREAELERAALQAKLYALQAQVEPHFLFNTLANLKYLIRTDTDTAQQMVDHLVAYLQNALPDMRSVSSTVGRELALTRHYLQLMQIRMGERLRFVLDAPSDLSDAALPPAMLISLVENAVKHGLERATRPGTISVNVTQDAEQLVIVVADDGIGLQEQAGEGFGLSNLHERLTLLYGKTASLLVVPGSDHGVSVTLRIPLNFPDRSGHA